MRIGEISRRSGFSIDTLRYYEKIGMLDVIARDQGNQRIYSEADLTWLSFIAKLKATDMPLDQIRDYAHLRKQGDHTADQRRHLLEDHLAQLEARLSDLNSCRDLLRKKVGYYRQMELSAAE